MYRGTNLSADVQKLHSPLEFAKCLHKMNRTYIDLLMKEKLSEFIRGCGENLYPVLLLCLCLHLYVHAYIFTI